MSKDYMLAHTMVNDELYLNAKDLYNLCQDKDANIPALVRWLRQHLE